MYAENLIKVIAKKHEIDLSKYDMDELIMGMDVELEHGSQNPVTDVTGDDPELTFKIVLAHMDEDPKYYTKLEKMEGNKEQLDESAKRMMRLAGLSEGEDKKYLTNESFKQNDYKGLLAEDYNKYPEHIRNSPEFRKKVMPRPKQSSQAEKEAGAQAWYDSNKKPNMPRPRARKPMEEGLSEKGISKVAAMVEKLGERATAKKMIDQRLGATLMGMGSEDLGDTAIFANGLDAVEELLQDKDYNGAWEVAKETAMEMIEDEGGGMFFEEKNINNSTYGGEEFDIHEFEQSEVRKEENHEELYALEESNQIVDLGFLFEGNK